MWVCIIQIIEGVNEMAYKCKFCGNEENFIEHNLIATEVIVNKDELEIVRNEFLDCLEVICGECAEQIIEDGEYIDRKSN